MLLQCDQALPVQLVLLLFYGKHPVQINHLVVEAAGFDVEHHLQTIILPQVAVLHQISKLCIGGVAPALAQLELGFELPGYPFGWIGGMSDFHLVLVLAYAFLSGGGAFHSAQLHVDGDIHILARLAAVGVDLQPPFQVAGFEGLSVYGVLRLPQLGVVAKREGLLLVRRNQLIEDVLLPDFHLLEDELFPRPDDLLQQLTLFQNQLGLRVAQ